MMNNIEVGKWLDGEWAAAIGANETHPDPEIDALANSKWMSVRYALVTQLLGKIADPSRNLLMVQMGEGGDGAWDARSFSMAVIVPWVSGNQHVLGTSAEPYASKPLRRVRLEYDMANVKGQGEWNALVALFEELEAANDGEIREIFRRVLRSLVRRLASQTFGYAIPQRVSLGRLQTILDEFLSVSSGGLRPLATTAALMRIVGEAFSLFSKVEAQGINEADAAGGVPGDVICYCHDDSTRICLVIEVKDLQLTLGHVDATSLKARQADAGLANVLFTVPGIRASERADIETRVAQEWASGMNIYTISIKALVDALFVLVDESWRARLVREIGDELDRRQDQAARKAWHDLLVTKEGNQ